MSAEGQPERRSLWQKITGRGRNDETPTKGASDSDDNIKIQGDQGQLSLDQLPVIEEVQGSGENPLSSSVDKVAENNNRGQVDEGESVVKNLADDEDAVWDALSFNGEGGEQLDEEEFDWEALTFSTHIDEASGGQPEIEVFSKREFSDEDWNALSFNSRTEPEVHQAEDGTAGDSEPKTEAEVKPTSLSEVGSLLQRVMTKQYPYLFTRANHHSYNALLNAQPNLENILENRDQALEKSDSETAKRLEEEMRVLVKGIINHSSDLEGVQPSVDRLQVQATVNEFLSILDNARNLSTGNSQAQSLKKGTNEDGAESKNHSPEFPESMELTTNTVAGWLAEEMSTQFAGEFPGVDFGELITTSAHDREIQQNLAVAIKADNENTRQSHLHIATSMLIAAALGGNFYDLVGSTDESDELASRFEDLVEDSKIDPVVQSLSERMTRETRRENSGDDDLGKPKSGGVEPVASGVIPAANGAEERIDWERKRLNDELIDKENQLARLLAMKKASGGAFVAEGRHEDLNELELEIEELRERLEEDEVLGDQDQPEDEFQPARKKRSIGALLADARAAFAQGKNVLTSIFIRNPEEKPEEVVSQTGPKYEDDNSVFFQQKDKDKLWKAEQAYAMYEQVWQDGQLDTKKIDQQRLAELNAEMAQRIRENIESLTDLTPEAKRALEDLAIGALSAGVSVALAELTKNPVAGLTPAVISGLLFQGAAWNRLLRGTSRVEEFASRHKTKWGQTIARIAGSVESQMNTVLDNWDRWYSVMIGSAVGVTMDTVGHLAQEAASVGQGTAQIIDQTTEAQRAPNWEKAPPLTEGSATGDTGANGNNRLGWIQEMGPQDKLGGSAGGSDTSQPNRTFFPRVEVGAESAGQPLVLSYDNPDLKSWNARVPGIVGFTDNPVVTKPDDTLEQIAQQVYGVQGGVFTDGETFTTANSLTLAASAPPEAFSNQQAHREFVNWYSQHPGATYQDLLDNSDAQQWYKQMSKSLQPGVTLHIPELTAVSPTEGTFAHKNGLVWVQAPTMRP